MDFNSSHVILTRIVSEIRGIFRNRNPTNVARTATIFVYIFNISRQTERWLKPSQKKNLLLLFGYFSMDSDDSHVILTSNVSEIRGICRNRNPTNEARTATILLCIFNISHQTERWLKPSQQKNLLLLFGYFSMDSNDSHVILTSNVSGIRGIFRNRNPTIVARTATILLCIFNI
jgi:hypothetical protein